MVEWENLGCYCYIPTFCWRNRKLVQKRKTINQLMSNANIKLRELKKNFKNPKDALIIVLFEYIKSSKPAKALVGLLDDKGAKSSTQGNV